MKFFNFGDDGLGTGIKIGLSVLVVIVIVGGIGLLLQ